jgi:flagellar biosynthetic protein FliO
MSVQKKKLVMFLAFFALFCGGLIAEGMWGSRSHGGYVPDTSSSRRVLDSNSGDDSGEKGRVFSRTDTDGSAGGLSGGELFFRMLVMVLVVISLGAATVYISRKYGSRLRGLSGREIQVIETTSIGPRKQVHIVKVGKKRLLIGSTNEHISMLADVTDAPAEGAGAGEDEGDGARIPPE